MWATAQGHLCCTVHDHVYNNVNGSLAAHWHHTHWLKSSFAFLYKGVPFLSLHGLHGLSSLHSLHGRRGLSSLHSLFAYALSLHSLHGLHGRSSLHCLRFHCLCHGLQLEKTSGRPMEQYALDQKQHNKCMMAKGLRRSLHVFNLLARNEWSKRKTARHPLPVTESLLWNLCCGGRVARHPLLLRNLRYETFLSHGRLGTSHLSVTPCRYI